MDDEELDTLWQDLPTCPYCAALDHDWWDGLKTNVGDGSEWVSTCGNCNRDYKVEMCVETTFTTSKPVS